jgi:hypothetical protein
MILTVSIDWAEDLPGVPTELIIRRASNIELPTTSATTRSEKNRFLFFNFRIFGIYSSFNVWLLG